MFRQYLTILLIFLFQITAVFGQKTISKIDFELVIDHLNCEIAKFYIEQEQGIYQLEAYNDSITQFGCSFEHLMVFIKKRQPQMFTNGYLAQYINNLKMDYDSLPTNHALYNKVVDVFKEEVLINYDSNEDYQLFKENIIANLKEELKVNEMANNELVEIESNSWTNFQDLQGWQIVFIIFSILFFIILIAFIRWGLKYARTGKENSKAFLNRNKQQNSPANSKPEEATNSKPKEATKTTLPKTVIEQKIEVPVVLIEEKAPEEAVQDKEPIIFYMPYPKIDGSFYESARHETFESSKSRFKFEIKIIEYNLATFEIISNEDVITDIFINPEIINPVCEIEGKQKKINSTLRSGISKIITVKSGTVQLQNSHWRLKQKAVIRFEYE